MPFPLQPKRQCFEYNAEDRQEAENILPKSQNVGETIITRPLKKINKKRNIWYVDKKIVHIVSTKAQMKQKTYTFQKIWEGFFDTPARETRVRRR